MQNNTLQNTSHNKRGTKPHVIERNYGPLPLELNDEKSGLHRHVGLYETNIQKTQNYNRRIYTK